MVPQVLEIASIGIAGFTLIVSLTLFHLARKRMVELESDLADIAERQKKLMQIEKGVMEKNPDYENFEKTVTNLSERLFQLVKEKYGFGGVTTYEEIIEALEELDQDEDIIDDLEEFFRYLEKIEYSDEDLDPEDKAIIRQSAFRLLRRAGSGLEQAELHTPEG
jgi:uncharacterized tellurite resistance protein B-like protein